MQLKDSLLQIARLVAVKLSPMADIDIVVRSLGPHCRRIDVVSSSNECKEVVAYLDREYDGECTICAKCSGKGEFLFTRTEENAADAILPGQGLNRIMSESGTFLLEPDRALLKAGAFRLPCARFGLRKLAPSTHLYLAGPGGTPPSGLFGRFAIEELLPLNSASVRLLKSRRLRADVSARNLPLGSAELARRLGCVSDAGLHVFGCATACSGNLLILARPLRESQP